MLFAALKFPSRIRTALKILNVFLPAMLLFTVSISQAVNSNDTRTIDIEYTINGANSVTFIWGDIHWAPLHKKYHPPNTTIVDGKMYSPMVKVDNIYRLKIDVPVIEEISYGFLVTESDPNIEGDWPLWDGNYKSTANVIERNSSLLSLKHVGTKEYAIFVFAVLLALAFLIFFAIAIFRSPSSARRALPIILLNVGSLALLLIAIEAFLVQMKIFPPSIGSPTKFGYWQDTSQENDPHPALGWVSDRNLVGVNDDGFRDPRDFDKLTLVQDDTIRVMVLGDSFAWGLGTAPEKTFARFLEKDLGPGFSVYNLAISGAGLGQMFVAYHLYKSKIRPDVVVLLFIDDDTRRVLAGGRPLFRIDDGKPRMKNALTDWELRLQKLSEKSRTIGLLAKEFLLVPQAQRLSMAFMKEMSDELGQHNVPFIAVRVPVPPDHRYLRSLWSWIPQLEYLANSLDINFHDMTRHFSGYPEWESRLYLNDPGRHFSTEGSRHAARFVSELITEYQPSNSKPVKNATKLVEASIVYDGPLKGQKALLLWGVNGWRPVEPDQLPEGSEIKGGLALSPISLVNRQLSINLTVPSGTMIDYVFQFVDENGDESYDTNNEIGYRLLAR